MKTTRAVMVLWLALFFGCAHDGRSNLDKPAEALKSTYAYPVNVYEAKPSTDAGTTELVIPTALSVEGGALVLAERAGRVVSLHTREGMRVSKGAILARLDDEDQRTMLAQAEIEVDRLKVEEQQFESLVKLSRSEFEREKALARDGVSSTAEVERAQYKLEQAIKEHEKTKLATHAGQSKVRTVELEIEKSVIRAPIAGVIIRSHITLGSNVAQNDKLFEVFKMSPLELKFRLPQNGNQRLTVGTILNLSSLDDDRLIARARIRRIDPVADAVSNTFGYLADVVGGRNLMPGMSVNVHLPRGEEMLSFWIPRSAFETEADLRKGISSIVFVVEGERAIARSVVISKLEGDQVEIISGLSANERVILLPPVGIKDQDRIEINPG